MMKSCSIVLLAAASISLAASSASSASGLPSIKVSDANKVPACATPGRMMAFLASRNKRLDDRFNGVATAYMRHGEELGIRWDYAFFQMILETGGLSFMRGNGRPGLVKASQNNFAGLGATGGKETGESFPDVDKGVRAHLQHLLMYAGHRVENPVAERTRKVQEWGVLTSWHKRFNRPITFADLAAKWAPGSRGYARDIGAVGEQFYSSFCNRPDPRPHLVAEARGETSGNSERPQPNATAESSKGVELARQALERAKAENDGRRSSLGVTGGQAARTAAQPEGGKGAAKSTGLVILNPQKSEPQQEPVKAEGTPPQAAESAPAAIKVAAATAKAPPAPKDKCRVWTASYGGQKSVIIKSTTKGFINFTVLDVNDGQEARETDACIAAYAKGGEKIGEFSNQNLALDRAFQLCPEG
jgi:hypothetical protein